MVAPPRRRPSKTIVQLRVSLIEHTPTIWRRLLVPGEIKLSKLHSIFQAAIGWEGYHLHIFEIGESRYGEPHREYDNDDIDEETVVLADLITGRMRFVYEYDFGDSWRHEVVVESFEPVPLILKFAVCLDGQRACPPEDCGGTHGYGEFLEAIGDPDHEEHEDYVAWVGHPFDPEAFDLAMTNAALQRVR
jgi:hypothetical protein